MATLLCFGLGYSAEHFVGMFGDGFERIVGTVRGAERAAVLNAHFGGRLKALVFDGTLATPEVKSAIGEADCRAGFDPADREGRSGACGLRRCAWRRRAVCARSSICRRSESTATTAAPGSTRTTPPRPDSDAQPRTAGRRARLARFRRARAALPSPSCGSPASMDPGATRWCRSRAAMRGASSSPARSSTASMSTTSRKRSTRRSRAGAAGIFNVADDEPTPPGDPIVFAAQLLGRDPPPEIPFEEAAPSMSPMALELLAGMPARAQRQAQTRARRDAALSDLPRGVTSVVRGRAARPIAVTIFPCGHAILQCRLGPLRKRSRSPDFTRRSMVSPSR